MKLNISKGNMYQFVTHTANAIKGRCYHNCSYCYMKKWGELSPVRLDEKELKIPMTAGNFIFVGSSCDMFSNEIPDKWIERVLNHCREYDNQYLFQTKNPHRLLFFDLPEKSVVCTTIETNRVYPQMGNAPTTWTRATAMTALSAIYKTFVTIEPIMDFDLDEMMKFIYVCDPEQINIGANSGGNNLPEPGKKKLERLIYDLNLYYKVIQKPNIKRLLQD